MGRKGQADRKTRLLSTHSLQYTPRLKRLLASVQAQAKASLTDHSMALSDKHLAQYTDTSAHTLSLSPFHLFESR